MTETEISRDAQLMGYAFFGLGGNSSVVFNTPSRVTERAMKGLEELEQAG